MNNIEKVELGKIICTIRKKNNMSQDQFAEAIGRTSGKVVSRWECGMCRPNDDALKSIEKRFDVSLKEFYSNKVEIVKTNNKTVIAILIIFIVILLLVCLFLCFNYEKTYNIYSSSADMKINGLIVKKKNKNFLYINSVNLQGVDDISCYSVDTTIKYQDYVLYKYGDVKLYEFSDDLNNNYILLKDYIKDNVLFFEFESIKNPGNKTYMLTFTCLKNKDYNVNYYNYEFIAE